MLEDDLTPGELSVMVNRIRKANAERRDAIVAQIKQMPREKQEQVAQAIAAAHGPDGEERKNGNLFYVYSRIDK
jgi:hypothetical protein